EGGRIGIDLGGAVLRKCGPGADRYRAERGSLAQGKPRRAEAEHRGDQKGEKRSKHQSHGEAIACRGTAGQSSAPTDQLPRIDGAEATASGWARLAPRSPVVVGAGVLASARVASSMRCSTRCRMSAAFLVNSAGRAGMSSPPEACAITAGPRGGGPRPSPPF